MTDGGLAVIGVDPGNTSGAAAITFDNNGPLVVASSSGKHTPPDVELDTERWISYWRWLEAFVHDVQEEYTVDALAFEDVKGHRGRKAAQVYGGFKATTLLLADENRIPVVLVHTGTLKKWVTGEGNAKKGAMLSAARHIPGVGLGLTDHNVADAIHLANFGAHYKLR